MAVGIETLEEYQNLRGFAFRTLNNYRAANFLVLYCSLDKKMYFRLIIGEITIEEV